MTAITTDELTHAYEEAVAGLTAQNDKLRAELAAARAERDAAAAQLAQYRLGGW